MDTSVTTSNLSKTGSVDVIVESPLEGLHVSCEATVDTNRIVTITATLDKGTNYDFVLENGHSFVNPVPSPNGRFRLLYPQPGLYNLSIMAKNHISKLQTVFTVRAVDPDVILISPLDFPAVVVVNETIPLNIVPESGTLQVCE